MKLRKVTFRRGFKTEANEIAREVRKELGLPFSAPLNPFILAEHLEIPVIGMSTLKDDVPESVMHFSNAGQTEFSAMTIFAGRKRLIVHNDSHSRRRQHSNIAHELSHGLLMHPPAPALNDFGLRQLDKEIENEADWLSGALLVTEEAALNIARRKLSIEAAADLYDVTVEMMQFRINVTGAMKRAAQASRWQ